MTTVRTRPVTWIGELDRRALWVGAGVVVGGYMPLTLLGPGTDLDVGGVYWAGRSILDGTYQVSRPPGAPVFEAITALLHAVGGATLVNVASVAMAVVTALAVARLLQREAAPAAGWLGLAVLVNPFVWIAGTSMVDFLWALGFALAGANLQLSRRLGPAALLYALAAGCRVSTLLIVGAFVVGDALGDREARRRLAAMGAVVLGLTGLVFVPALVELGRGIVESAPQSSTWLVQLGRFGAKNVFFFGPVVIGLMLWHVPQLLRTILERWSRSVVLRAGLLGVVASELLFLRFPWKLAHLIPVFVCLVLVLGSARVLSVRLVGVLVAAQLLLGVVTLNVAQPDQPSQATGGELSIELVEGQWLRDLRCRLDSDREAYRLAGSPGLLDTWDCAVPWTD